MEDYTLSPAPLQGSAEEGTGSSQTALRCLARASERERETAVNCLVRVITGLELTALLCNCSR